MPGIRDGWRRFRSHFWLSLAFDVAVLALLLFAVHSWQTRNLPIDQEAPQTVLAALDGSGPRPALAEGVGVVYFFAPWCRVCRVSIDNLDALVAGGAVDWGTVVALDYADTGEVQDFIDRTGVALPVLLGDGGTARDWSIRAFPTYYLIGADGRIHSRAVGYSTALGMRWRAWRAR
jgi:hypothetical protein